MGSSEKKKEITLNEMMRRRRGNLEHDDCRSRVTVSMEARTETVARHITKITTLPAMITDVPAYLKDVNDLIHNKGKTISCMTMILKF